MPAGTTIGVTPAESELRQRIAELTERLRAREEEHGLALQREAAISDLLQVINGSGGDRAPFFDAMLDKAMTLCGAAFGFLTDYDGTHFKPVAMRGVPPPLAGYFEQGMDQPRPGESHHRILQGEDVVHNLDQKDEEAYRLGSPLRRAIVDLGGARTALVVALRKEGTVLGALTIYRKEVRAFSDKEIALLQTFAAQAVIAMENARLLGALRDSLARLKAAQANLIQAEKMASLGQLTAGIAHEIKNPLNFVNNFAGLSGELVEELKQAVDAMLARPDEAKRAELHETMDLLTGNLARIVEHGRRADGIVKSMLSHSRGGTGDWQECSIDGLVEEALNLACHGARAQDKDFDVALERDLAAARPIEIVPQDITRVLLNLLGNGFYAVRQQQRARSDGGYRPTLKVSTRDLGDAVEVRVRDNGAGIVPEVRARLFEPFFTTKPTGEGTGLGLSISYDIVTQQHGGTIEVESEPGSFTEFTVCLPRSRRIAQPRAER